MQNKNLAFETHNEHLLDDINKKNAEMENQQLELKKNLEEINASRHQEEKQNWIARGLADISEIFRQESGEQVYNILLTRIVKYVRSKPRWIVFGKRG